MWLWSDSALTESSVFEKKKHEYMNGVVLCIVSICMEYCAKSTLYNRASRLHMLMWTDGFPKNIRFTWTVQKCQRICVIMTVWFDRHHRNHLNKVPCNQKMLPDSDWCTERKGNLFFKTELPTQTSGSLAVKKKKTSFQENCLLKIDVPSA